jgi:hypothetical protein
MIGHMNKKKKKFFSKSDFQVGIRATKQICGEILKKDPIPELEECCALVCREYVRHTKMKGEPKNSEASAMVTRN